MCERFIMASKRFIMANVLVALSIVGTAIGLLCTDYPSWWHGVWFGTLGLLVLLSFVLPLLVAYERTCHQEGSAMNRIDGPEVRRG